MFQELKTDDGLLRRLTIAARRALTTEELRSQRVSYVYGNMPQDSTMTRGEVEAVLDRVEGRAA